jgi:eukaryotic-like serine/threonine-protein kinase
MQVDPARLEEIFGEALTQADGAARAAYLSQACANDPDLRQRVEALLAAHEATDNLLRLPAADSAANAAISEGPGSKIGRYKLLEEIGEGGFGVVFMAEQEQPVRRKVALKIIKAGMDTRQVVARFEAERQALAMMDHPNIAKVLDAGATETGRPYFVMELIKGIPITQYCDQQSLSIADRMQLFIQVCQAVQHAHQKGIIHRDLKPSNVLITLHDDKAVPKIIDFGVAKAIEGKLTEKTLFTGFHQLIGTPTYMSPEQAQLSGIDVDTRSDIYSLGVLLYELLTGTTPLDAKTLLSNAFDEMQRMIREDEPPKPSTRVSTLADDTQTARASQRSSDPKRLTQQLRGDLDWIVMRCLEKDRTRRYETAAGLADDVQRYLSDQPVEACRPTHWYRLKKFIRRNKLGVLAGSLIATALAAGLILASIGFLQAHQQAQISHTQAARSEQVAQFLKDTLAAAGPSVARGRDATLMREILDKTADRVAKELQDQPEVQGDLWMTLGSTYSDIGDDQRAIPLFRRAVDCYQAALGSENAKLALALARLGARQGFVGDVSTGKANAQRGLEIARKCGDPEIIERCLVYLASSCSQYGFYTHDVVPCLREALALRKELNNDPIKLADCQHYLALALFGINDKDDAEAEQLFRESLAVYRERLPDHPKIVWNLWGLGQLLLQRGRLEEAESVMREAWDIFTKIYDTNATRRWDILRCLAQVMALRGKGLEAEEMVREQAEALPSKIRYLVLLGALKSYRGDWSAAADQFLRAIETDPNNSDARFDLAFALLEAGRYDDYRKQCHEFLDGLPECSAAAAALLLPVDGADFQRACQLADSAATATGTKQVGSWDYLVKALAELRRKRYESAVDWANHAIAGENLEAACKANAWFIQAAAFANLQQRESAQAALAKGDELAEQTRSTTVLMDEGSQDWFIQKYLRPEAARLIDEPSPAAKP